MAATMLPHPWDSPAKNTGVGCHFLLQCRKVKSESEVAQSCPTLHDPMDCSLPHSSIHGIFQARVLEWGAIAFSENLSLLPLFLLLVMKWWDWMPWSSFFKRWVLSQLFHSPFSSSSSGSLVSLHFMPFESCTYNDGLSYIWYRRWWLRFRACLFPAIREQRVGTT